jgi:hypothetical protein
VLRALAGLAVLDPEWTGSCSMIVVGAEPAAKAEAEAMFADR